MSRFIPWLVLACACGGGAGSDALGIEVPGDELTAVPQGLVLLSVDVYPAEVRSETDSTAFRALPQTLIPTDLEVADTMDVGRVNLPAPRVLSGVVTGETVNPFISADLPGDSGPIAAGIFVRRQGTVQSYATRTESDGSFASWVVPASEYQFAVVPDDPMVPMLSQELPVGANTVAQDVDLGIGVPIYGRIGTASGAMQNGRVHVVDERGFVSASAIANSFGLYQLRVQPGTFDVVSEGRQGGGDPILVERAMVVGDDGLNVDFEYPTDLDQILVEGEVTASLGPSPNSVVVRFTAESLEGFADGEGRWTWETVAGRQNGRYLDRMLPGVYTVEYIPPTVDDGPDFTPVRLVGVDLRSTVVLPTVELLPLVAVEGSVVSQGSAPLAGAQISCSEIGFDGRSWYASTDEEGHFDLDLPGVPVSCIVAPPGTAPGLASARVEIDPALNTTPTIVLDLGRRVIGEVTVSGTPETFALVEVRNARGELLGVGLTDEDGEFSVPVALEPADVFE